MYDPILMRPMSYRGSRRLWSTLNTYFQPASVGFSTSDFTIAIAIWTTTKTLTNWRPFQAGATSDTSTGVRLLGGDGSITIAISDGTARPTGSTGANSIVGARWNWLVLNVVRGGSASAWVYPSGDMETAKMTLDVSSLAGNIGPSTTLIGGTGAAGQTLDNARIAALAIVAGGTWDQDAREDWIANRGVWANLAAGTKANMARYYALDERAGDAIDATETSNALLKNGPARSWKRPW